MNLSIWILLPGIGAIVIATAFIAYARIKKCPWSYIGLGALAWVIVTIVKFLVATPITPWVYQLVYVPDDVWASGSMLFYVYIGVLTALTEVLLTWMVLRYTRLGEVPWTKALAFGIGFGVIEAFYQGIPSLVANISALMAPESLTSATISSLQVLNNPLFGLGPGTDRFFATLIHVFANTLLFYGVISKQGRWLWIAFAYKCVVDTVAAFGMFWGVETLSRLWRLEAVLWILGFVALWSIRKIQKRYSFFTMPENTSQSTAFVKSLN